MAKHKKKSSNRLVENYRKVLLQYINGKRFTRISEKELLNKLAVPEQHEALFHTLLQEHVDTGVLLKTEDNLYIAPQEVVEHVRGILRSHPRGFGFVEPKERKRYPQDIFIPKHLTSTAVDGDIVDVEITGFGGREKGPEGRIITVVTRNRTHIAGTVRTLQSPTESLCYVPILGNTQPVYLQHDVPLQVGDRIVMEIIDWGENKQGTRARFSHMIGPISDATRDVAAAVELFQIRGSFDVDTQQESLKFGTRIPQAALKEREDLREHVCLTIDPDTAKDFDDALSLTQDANGVYHLGVHIADVSYYVRPGTHIDREAALRCNSTYFPGTCIPMLPNTLSENLCSLKPNVNRLTVSVLMRYSQDGQLLDYRMTRSVIRSQKRLTYGEAKEILDGKRRSPHRAMLEKMVILCKLLKKQRQSRGSIELSVPELSLEIDPVTGIPVRTTIIEYDITHQMVEEFMLKANELVAQHLSRQGAHLSYRVHEEPAEENRREFVELARYFGFALPDNPTAEDLQTLFNNAQHTPYAAHLATSFIRSMRLAIYSSQNIGHYGLQLTHYCHFTSPIRRYVDLVIHRILFGDARALEEIELISKQCSDQERLSAKAEGYVRTLKKLRLLDQQHQADPHASHSAIVTRIKPFGLFFEITSLFLEGFLHISALGSDYFVYDALHNQLKGRHTGKTFRCTDRITVILERVDLIMLDATWSMEEEDTIDKEIRTFKSIKRDSKKAFKKARKDKGKRKGKGKSAQLEMIAEESAPPAKKVKAYVKAAEKKTEPAVAKPTSQANKPIKPTKHVAEIAKSTKKAAKPIKKMAAPASTATAKDKDKKPKTTKKAAAAVKAQKKKHLQVDEAPKRKNPRKDPKTGPRKSEDFFETLRGS